MRAVISAAYYRRYTLCTDQMYFDMFQNQVFEFKCLNTSKFRNEKEDFTLFRVSYSLLRVAKVVCQLDNNGLKQRSIYINLLQNYCKLCNEKTEQGGSLKCVRT